MTPVRDIIASVSAETGISAKDITGPARFAHIVRARDIVCLRAHEAGRTYPQIARVLNRDHTTVGAAAKRAAARMEAHA